MPRVEPGTGSRDLGAASASIQRAEASAGVVGVWLTLFGQKRTFAPTIAKSYATTQRDAVNAACKQR